MWSLKSSVQIIWHFTPPKNPHNCKVLEVMVKATKRSLKSLCCYLLFNIDKPQTFVAATASVEWQTSDESQSQQWHSCPNSYKLNFLIDNLDCAVSTDQIDIPVWEWQVVQSVMKKFWKCISRNWGYQTMEICQTQCQSWRSCFASRERCGARLATSCHERG